MHSLSARGFFVALEGVDDEQEELFREPARTRPDI
jgi:hypothetical protein